MSKVKSLNAGQIQLSIWENESKESNRMFHSITLKKSYKDSDDKWQDTQSFHVSDLPSIQMLLNKAYELLMLKV